MIRSVHFVILLPLFMLACATVLPAAESTATAIEAAASSPSQHAASEFALVDAYDPGRDPARDLEQAISLAGRQNKRIMLELGGDWCIWCKYMDEFYSTHNDILQFRNDHYVLVKVNVSPENENEEFLSQYPEAAGYPHIHILDSDGTFLHSQDTAELEDGADSYVPEVFMDFLQKWAK